MIDLLVAGGGPVGLGTAIAARLAGLDVTVVEPRADPIDKACGEGLMPGAVAALAGLGVRPEGRPFRGIRYLRAADQAEALFRCGPGLGVRRPTLQAALTARAADLGVGRIRARVTGIRQYGEEVEAAGVRARWLVAADGLHSPIRRELGLVRPGPARPRFGIRRHYTVAPWTDLVEVHWSRDAEAYVTPVADDTVGVAILCNRGQRYDEVLREFPRLGDRLKDAVATPARAAGPLRQRTTARTAGRVLLVGDAAGYVDALTGEGVATGLASGAAAVRCIVAGRPEDYDAAWATATRRYRVLTGALLAASQRAWLRDRLVPAARRLPRAFDGAVNLLA